MATPAEVPRGAEINGFIGKPLYPPTLVANAFCDIGKPPLLTIAYLAIGGTRVGHRLRHSPSVPRHRPSRAHLHSITLAGSDARLCKTCRKSPWRPQSPSASHSWRANSSRRDQARRNFSKDYPWIFAFVFGLLHGFGFAGALKETGLPHTDITLALFTFNLGV